MQKPQAVLLSTCNRSEMYCEAKEREQVIDWFCRQHPVSQCELLPLLYCYEGQDAIQHMMEVACGLDSMVLGESQILGQMKDAFSESCAAGAVSTLFNRLFQHVFSVAKEVRTNTAIGACPVSVSSAAVHFIKSVYKSDFNQANILLIGAGLTAELVLRHLKNDANKNIYIANRSIENAKTLAEKYGGRPSDFKALPSLLKTVDIVISATGSPSPIVTKEMLLDRTQPLWMVDIAVPRDIDVRISEMESIYLYSIDDLKTIIQQHMRGREHAALKAREVIIKKTQDLMQWIQSLDRVAMTIRAYRKQIEDLSNAELAKAWRQLERGDDPVQVLTSFAHVLTNKLLHTPSVQLRKASVDGRLEILEWAEQLFALPEVKSTLL